MKCGIALVFLFFLTSSAYAGGDVVADLSSATIAVNTGFTGTTLTVFGVVDGHDDIVVVIEGPEGAFTVRHKSKHYGLWIADSAVSFNHVPKFFALALSKPSLLPISETELEARGLVLKTELTPGSNDETGDFRSALIRLEQERGLYNFNAKTIIVKSGKLFRADFDLPVNVPIGEYRVHIAALHGGVIVAARTLPLTIDESGIADMVQTTSVTHPFFYSFFTLIAVLVIGAVSTSLSIVRKRK